jgi:pyrroline-5-carboxylate reductase
MSGLNRNIGFIGAGNMAEAIIGALIRSGLSHPDQIVAFDIHSERLADLRERYGIISADGNFDVFLACDVVILAVKPQFFRQAVDPVVTDPRYGVPSRKLILSIIAGVSIRKMEELFYGPLGEKSRYFLPIIRVMPNTPALVLTGISGLSANFFSTPADIETASTILKAMGKVIEFEEEALDAVTAVSGSGPAYVFFLMECMMEAAVREGLKPEHARELTVETIRGAVRLFEESRESAESLRKKVTSPKGTTEAAFRVLEQRNVRDAWIQAIAAAAARSRELGKM